MTLVSPSLFIPLAGQWTLPNQKQCSGMAWGASQKANAQHASLAENLNLPSTLLTAPESMATTDTAQRVKRPEPDL